MSEPRLELEGTAVRAGALSFTKRAIEKRREGQLVVSFARRDIEWVRVAKRATAERPLMQILFAVGLVTGGCVTVGSAVESGKVLEWLGGPVLVLLGVMVFIHTVRRTTVLVVSGKDARAMVALDVELSPPEIAQLNRRLAEMGWPVGKPAPRR